MGVSAINLVNLFGKIKLIVDTDAESIAKICAELQKEGVRYSIHTKQIRSSSPKMIRTPNMPDIGVGFGTFNPMDNIYVYTVYVKRQDLGMAKKIAHL